MVGKWQPRGEKREREVGVGKGDERVKIRQRTVWNYHAARLSVMQTCTRDMRKKPIRVATIWCSQATHDYYVGTTTTLMHAIWGVRIEIGDAHALEGLRRA